jgi:hypothetical protein
MTVNSGDPISALASALDAYIRVQETMIAESQKLKASGPATTPNGGVTTEGGATNAVPAGS